VLPCEDDDDRGSNDAGFDVDTTAAKIDSNFAVCDKIRQYTLKTLNDESAQWSLNQWFINVNENVENFLDPIHLKEFLKEILISDNSSVLQFQISQPNPLIDSHSVNQGYVQIENRKSNMDQNLFGDDKDDDDYGNDDDGINCRKHQSDSRYDSSDSTNENSVTDCQNNGEIVRDVNKAKDLDEHSHSDDFEQSSKFKNLQDKIDDADDDDYDNHSNKQSNASELQYNKSKYLSSPSENVKTLRISHTVNPELSLDEVKANPQEDSTEQKSPKDEKDSKKKGIKSALDEELEVRTIL
jgi:hypothetical protein